MVNEISAQNKHINIAALPPLVHMLSACSHSTTLFVSTSTAISFALAMIWHHTVFFQRPDQTGRYFHSHLFPLRIRDRHRLEVIFICPITAIFCMRHRVPIARHARISDCKTRHFASFHLLFSSRRILYHKNPALRHQFPNYV